jgi:hypothetical protein
VVRDRESLSLAGSGLVPDLFEEGCVVRQHNHLSAGARQLHDLMHRLPAPERILTVERIVEYDRLCRKHRIAFEIRDEEGQRQRRPIAGAERVLEARCVRRLFAVTDVDRRLVDDELIARSRSPAGIAVARLCDRETGVESVEEFVNAPLIRLDDALRMIVELLADRRLALIDVVLLGDVLPVRRAQRRDLGGVAGFDGFE